MTHSEQNKSPLPPLCPPVHGGMKGGERGAGGIFKAVSCMTARHPFERRFVSDSVEVSIPTHESFPGPVVYGSLEWDTAQHSSASREDVKVRLLATLLEHVFSSDGHGTHSCRDIRIVKDALGRPLLRIPGATGLAISFAHLVRKTWAAVSFGACRVGIDAAWSAEFRGRYPFQRAFRKEEFDYFVGKTGGNREESAAFLWSAKEAAVKSLGCGFRLVDPLCLSVWPLDLASEGSIYGVTLVGPARERFAYMGEEPIPVRAVRDRGIWISLAMIDAVRSRLVDRSLDSMVHRRNCTGDRFLARTPDKQQH